MTYACLPQGIFVLRGFHERLSPGRLYGRLEHALSLLDLTNDDMSGRPSAAGSSSGASHAGVGAEWRCTDSTSARSWHHFIASNHMSPAASALPHPVLLSAHSHQQHKLSD